MLSSSPEHLWTTGQSWRRIQTKANKLQVLKKSVKLTTKLDMEQC